VRLQGLMHKHADNEGLFYKQADNCNIEGMEEAAYYEVLGAVNEMAPTLRSDFDTLWIEHNAHYALGLVALARQNFHLATEYLTLNKVQECDFGQ
jgi:hypothetical protein